MAMKSKPFWRKPLKTIKEKIYYKIGLFFYTALFLFVFVLIGCKSCNQYLENRMIKNEAKAILDTPKLID